LRCRLFWCGEFPLYRWLPPLAIEPGNKRPGEPCQQEKPQGRAKEHAQHHETHASVHHHRIHHQRSTPFVCVPFRDLKGSAPVGPSSLLFLLSSRRMTSDTTASLRRETGEPSEGEESLSTC